MVLRRIPLTTAGLGLVALVLAVLIGRDVFFPPTTNSASTLRTATVAVGTVRSVVSGTGSLVPVTSMNVGFKSAGTLTEVDVKVGDKVTAGQTLGKIDATNLQVALDQANAQLATAQANLESTTNGNALAQAQHTLANAQQSYGDTVNSVNLTNSQDQATLSNDQGQLNTDSAQLAADQASPFFQNYNANMTQYQGYLSQGQAQFNLDHCSYPISGNQCNDDYVYMTNAQIAIGDLQNGTGGGSSLQVVQSAGQPATFYTLQVPTSVPQMAAAYKAVQADQAKVSADSSRVAGDQAKLNADVVSGQSRLTQAQNAITTAQDSLNNQTTQRPATLATQQAAVESAQAAVTTAQNNLNAAVLTAPIDGVVTAVNGNVGDNTSASGTSTPAASGTSGTSGTGSSGSGSSNSSSSAFVQLISSGTYQIQAPFAEADASRVQVGQTATVTYDAIQNLTEQAHVTLVAPTSTVTSNVVNYSITFALDQTDPRLRSGMTSNVTVTVASASNVLVVPNSAITRIGQRTFVTVLGGDGKQVRTPVTTGVVGDTTTEILSGLQAGDKVVLPQLRAGTTTTTNRGLGGGGGGGGGIRVGGGG